jgi:hypothetical protein
VTVQKPTVPDLSVSRIKDTLSRLEGLVGEAEKPDGTVDVSTLAAKVAATKDAALARGFETIKDAFEMTTSAQGPAAEAGPAVIRSPPTRLAATEVLSVFGALLKARSKIDALDRNDDGKLQASELEGNTGTLTGLAGKLAKGAVEAELKTYHLELSKWSDVLGAVVGSIENRVWISKEIDEQAAHHAATSAGREAIVWAYRDIATSGHGLLDVWDMRKQLADAERSWLKFLPFFGKSVTTADGHLGDDEVKRLFGTDDLEAFAAAKKESIEARLKMSHDDYLNGEDLKPKPKPATQSYASYSASC